MNDTTAPANPTAGTVVELDTAGFEDAISGNALALVDFWAPWCAPCRAFAPVFAAAAARHPDILFAKVNTEEQQALAASFNIRSIPTLMVFRDGILLFAQAGIQPAAALDQLVTKVQALDMSELRKKVAASKVA